MLLIAPDRLRRASFFAEFLASQTLCFSVQAGPPPAKRQPRRHCHHCYTLCHKTTIGWLFPRRASLLCAVDKTCSPGNEIEMHLHKVRSDQGRICPAAQAMLNPQCRTAHASPPASCHWAELCINAPQWWQETRALP